MSGDGKGNPVFGNPQNQFHYGTFQGVANYYQSAPQPQPQPQSVVGFPQPVAPPGVSGRYQGYHGHLGYHAVPVQGYAVMEGRPYLQEARLPCCGIGMGWFLFMIGFFLGGIPWYVGAFIVLFVPVDYREKPGYVACAIASVLAVMAITFGITNGSEFW